MTETADPIVTALREALREIAEKSRAVQPQSLVGAAKHAAPVSLPTEPSHARHAAPRGPGRGVSA